LASFSSQGEEKKINTKKKKTIKKKKNAKKGGSLPSSSRSALSVFALVFALLLLPFHFKHFFLASSSFQTEGKKRKTQRKKMQKVSKFFSSINFEIILFLILYYTIN
jgi:flagellar biosynthesis protein FlhB